jgi:hypothetical protein
VAGASIKAIARRDFPLPDGPRISTARLPVNTAEAWTVAVAASL